MIYLMSGGRVDADLEAGMRTQLLTWYAVQSPIRHRGYLITIQMNGSCVALFAGSCRSFYLLISFPVGLLTFYGTVNHDSFYINFMNLDRYLLF